MIVSITVRLISIKIRLFRLMFDWFRLEFDCVDYYLINIRLFFFQVLCLLFYVSTFLHSHPRFCTCTLLQKQIQSSYYTTNLYFYAPTRLHSYARFYTSTLVCGICTSTLQLHFGTSALLRFYISKLLQFYTSTFHTSTLLRL